jgi:hypothetical protein
MLALLPFGARVALVAAFLRTFLVRLSSRFRACLPELVAARSIKAHRSIELPSHARRPTSRNRLSAWREVG